MDDSRNPDEERRLRAQRLEGLGALTGGVAHDLGNMLAPVLLAAELLDRREDLDPESRRLLDTVTAGARRSSRLVRRVLAYARGEGDDRHEELAFGDLLSDAAAFAREILPRTVGTRVDVAEDLWAVPGDAVELHQVLLNLLLNARDAMPDGGHLTLTARNVQFDEAYAATGTRLPPGPYVRITVADTGHGMDAEVRARIFEPFFTTRGSAGTGLGLSTARTIAARHHGALEVTSAPGVGSTFTLHLPAVTATPGTAAQPPATDPAPGARVLLADPQPGVRWVAARALRALGHRVRTAVDGPAAVAELARHRDDLDVAVIDLELEHMDGAAVVRALWHLDATLPIVCTSARPPWRTDARGPGLDIEVLTKPYTASELADRIGAVLADGSRPAPPDPRVDRGPASRRPAPGGRLGQGR